MKDDELQVKKFEWKKFKGGLLRPWLDRQGIKINPWIVMFFVIVVPAVFLLADGVQHGWNQRLHVKCPYGVPYCDNIFVNCNGFQYECPSAELKEKACGIDPNICLLPILYQGQVLGTPYTWVEQYFIDVIIFSTLVGFGINWLLFNRKKQRVTRKLE
jgi:hypothetical protein